MAYKSFLCCLVVLHFVRPFFCDDHHRTRCTLLVHEKVLQLFWVSFASDAKLLVLESDFDQCLDRRFVIGFWDLGSLLHESSHEVL
jgi:hypothetical protein